MEKDKDQSGPKKEKKVEISCFWCGKFSKFGCHDRCWREFTAKMLNRKEIDEL